MACCAFAVFLLLNLLAPLGWLRRFGKRATPPANAAVAWRYGAGSSRPTATPARPRWRRAVAGAVAVELLALVALGAYLMVPAPGAGRSVDDWDALIALHTSWCRSADASAPAELSLLEQ